MMRLAVDFMVVLSLLVGFRNIFGDSFTSGWFGGLAAMVALGILDKVLA